MSQNLTSFRRLGRDSLIYTTGSVLSRAVSFLLLPLYTRYLTPADYGVLQLLDMTIDISVIIFTAGMTAGMALFYFQTSDKQERNDIVRTAFALEVSLSLLGAAVLFVLAPTVWKVVLRGSGEVLLVRIAAMNFVLGILSAVPMMLLQIRQQPQWVITINLLRLFAQVGLNVLFLVVLRQGVVGILLSGLIVNAVQGLGATLWLMRTAPGRARMSIVKRLRKFGVPYQISAGGSFILSFGDRFFLQASRGVSAVGLYGLAYQFGFLLYQLSAEPVLKAWGPQRLQLIGKPKDIRDETYNRGFVYFNLALITMATGIGLFVQPVIKVMTTAPFHGAARLVPVILLAYVIAAWGEAINFGIIVSQKTRYITYTTWTAVVVVCLLYALLIPLYGGMGAAIATAGAFAVRTSLLYYWAQKLWHIDYEWSRIARLTAYGIVAVAIMFMIPNVSIVNQGAIGLLLFLAYCTLTWITVLQSEERWLLINALPIPKRL
jgi:O-antigen/teichoic acid export membrane protein